MRSSPFLTCLLFALAVALGACGKQAESEAPPAAVDAQPTPEPEIAAPEAATPIAVVSLELGSNVGPDQKISQPSEAFAPTDSIYASVSTSGSAEHSTLEARWSYQDGQIVNRTRQTIAPDGPAVTSFRISKPDDWPKGDYKVDILLDDRPAASAHFSVH